MDNAISSSPQTIGREAADKTKGFRLQKLRAAKLMLEAVETHPNGFFYAAIEVVEDVSITKSDQNASVTYLEEDKNFDEQTNFTIFSEPVTNTLVSFFDIYTGNWKSSEEVCLGFYTTAGIGKERKEKLDNGTTLTLPKDPVLKILQSQVINDDTTKLVKAVLLEEYTKQYSGKKYSGYLDTLKDSTTEQFKKFLLSITWFFGQEDEKELKETVLKLIKNSKFHNFKVANKENIICSLIMERLDERQSMASLAARVVTITDLALIFKEAESEEVEDLLDPVWSELKKLEGEIKDKRNLKEKIQKVIPDYPVRRIGHFARMASRAKIEQEGGNKSFLALKYRIYEACEEYFTQGQYQEPNSSQNLDAIIQQLEQVVCQSISHLQSNYTYTVSNRETIRGVIMDLVDSCFISFEKN
ncbi:MAG: hypothetical protein HYS18_07335 [Burkholderiales bacterium]|nr:hypothetical protein [Burkholderiales bacterium]